MIVPARVASPTVYLYIEFNYFILFAWMNQLHKRQEISIIRTKEIPWGFQREHRPKWHWETSDIGASGIRKRPHDQRKLPVCCTTTIIKVRLTGNQFSSTHNRCICEYIYSIRPQRMLEETPVAELSINGRCLKQDAALYDETGLSLFLQHTWNVVFHMFDSMFHCLRLFVGMLNKNGIFEMSEHACP